MLRKEIKQESALGKKIETIINQGSFVSDNIINDLIEKVLSYKENKDRLIFDGFPRNLNQVKNLEILINKYNQKISCVLSFKVDYDILLKRITGRQICSQCGLIFNQYFKPSTQDNHSCGSEFLQKRSDDNEETLKNRLITYNEETLPVLNYYQKQKLLNEIDGMLKITLIYEEIRQIIASLKT